MTYRKIQWHEASHGLSATAELIVSYVLFYMPLWLKVMCEGLDILFQSDILRAIRLRSQVQLQLLTGLRQAVLNTQNRDSGRDLSQVSSLKSPSLHHRIAENKIKMIEQWRHIAWFQTLNSMDIMVDNVNHHWDDEWHYSQLLRCGYGVRCWESAGQNGKPTHGFGRRLVCQTKKAS